MFGDFLKILSPLQDRSLLIAVNTSLKTVCISMYFYIHSWYVSYLGFLTLHTLFVTLLKYLLKKVSYPSEQTRILANVAH